MTTSKKTKFKKIAKSKKPSVFEIDLKEIPNGTLKPGALCDFLLLMKNWRQRSAQSNILLQ